LDQITEEEKEEFNDLFWNNTIKIIAFRKNDQSIQANYKDVFDGRKGYIDIGINGIDWLRQKGFCLNPEWFESGLAIRYNPEKHGDW
jgi:hypothetical protein